MPPSPFQQLLAADFAVLPEPVRRCCLNGEQKFGHLLSAIALAP